MNLFREIEDKGIFKDERVFAPDYFPTEIIQREREKKELAYSVRSILNGASSSVVMFGPPGTGKTTLAKYVNMQLEEYSSKVLPIYINSWKTRSLHEIFGKIINSIDPLFSARGNSKSDLKSRLNSYLKSSGKHISLILDEADALGKKESEIIYEFTRFDTPISLILITNRKEVLLTSLDQRVRSSVSQSSIKFDPYPPEVLREILSDRAKKGLFFDAYDDSILGKIVGFSAKNGGDARIAISLLRESARIAERKGKNKISLGDVDEAKKSLANILESERLNELDLVDKKILNLLDRGPVRSSEIYHEFPDLSDRAIRKRLARLSELGLINSEEKFSRTGRERIIYYNRKY